MHRIAVQHTGYCPRADFPTPSLSHDGHAGACVLGITCRGYSCMSGTTTSTVSPVSGAGGGHRA
eukprot:4584571-Prymnesium_polylepis.1